MHLVLITSAGNQRYIFATNKLRENIGASELVHRVGTQFVLSAVREVGGPDLLAEPADWRRALLDPARNRPLTQAGTKAEVVVATSGLAQILVDSKETGHRIIELSTRQAAQEAPGLAMHGVIGEAFEFGKRPHHEVVGDCFNELQRAFSQTPDPLLRFQRVPIAAECATSGLPASRLVKYATDDRATPLSEASYRKRKLRQAALDRLKGLAGALPLASSVEDLERHLQELSWVAVVHADGNGIGSIFQNFDKRAEAVRPEDAAVYVDRLRRFSVALDECTEGAFCIALELWEEARRALPADESPPFLPLAPLVVGGDDLTLLCDAKGAVQFTRDFLVAFERRSADSTHHQGIIEQISGSRLTMAAGVAIVKPHFPFHHAYGLSEELLSSAKRVKTRTHDTSGRPIPCSALDFHVHHSQSGEPLQQLRDAVTVQDTALFGGPYVVTSSDLLSEVSDLAKRWLAPREWAAFRSRVEALLLEDPDEPGRKLLPRSQLHSLREALFRGRQAADAELALLKGRFSNAAAAALSRLMEGSGDSFVRYDADEAKRGGPSYQTSFLDAMSLRDLWIASPEAQAGGKP